MNKHCPAPSDRAKSDNCDSIIGYDEIMEALSVVTQREPNGKHRIDSGYDSDGRKGMHSLFVGGGFVSEGEFNNHWQPISESNGGGTALPFIERLHCSGCMSIEKSMHILLDYTDIPLLPLANYEVNLSLITNVPHVVCKSWCVLPVDHIGSTVIAATCNPFAQDAAAAIRSAASQSYRVTRLCWYLTYPADLIALINRFYQ